MRWLKIQRLQWSEFWQEIFADVERSRIMDATRNLKEMEKRLARTRIELDMLHAPQSLIMQALKRRTERTG